MKSHVHRGIRIQAFRNASISIRPNIPTVAKFSELHRYVYRPVPGKKKWIEIAIYTSVAASGDHHDTIAPSK